VVIPPLQKFLKGLNKSTSFEYFALIAGARFLWREKIGFVRRNVWIRRK
jgi:hypothetical protein